MGLMRILVCVIGVCLTATTVMADYVGTARLLTEDYIGDRHDRWRTGSYQIGLLYDPDLPPPGFDTVEIRFVGEAVAPWNMDTPAPWDRPFAGVLTAMALGHRTREPLEFTAGLGLSLTGPQTGVDWIAERVHLGDNDLSGPTRRAQIPNETYLHAETALAARLMVRDQAAIRPYVGLTVGVEDLAMVGADVILGRAGAGSMRSRDRVTGQLLFDTATQTPGFALTLGGDMIYVQDSALFPDTWAGDAKALRWRARGGVAWRGARGQMFYGLTWLSKEFDAQPEGQTVGSIHLNWKF